MLTNSPKLKRLHLIDSNELLSCFLENLVELDRNLISLTFEINSVRTYQGNFGSIRESYAIFEKHKEYLLKYKPMKIKL